MHRSPTAGRALRGSSFVQLHGVHGSHANSPWHWRRVTAPADHVDWRRVIYLASIAACATLAAQVVACPLDVAQKLAKRAQISVPAALARTFKTGTFFQGLPLRLVKRAPTKCLSVALLELANDKLHTSRARRKHFVAAAASSSVSLLATYPLHAAYYAMRKGVGLNVLLSCARYHYRNLYAGVLPALVAIVPVMLADQCLYKSLRAKISHAQRVVLYRTSLPTLVVNSKQSGAFPPSLNSTSQEKCHMAVDGVSLILAAAMSASLAHVLGEPFKQVSRRVAVESVRSASSGIPSTIGTARNIWARGPAEFWRGYRTRATHYAISASITRLTVEKLKGLL